MMFAMDALQVLHGHMGVDLRRGNVSVPEQPLNAAQVGPVLHHVSGAAMAKHVWAGFARVPLAKGGPHHLPYPLAGERPTAHAEEQGALHARTGEHRAATLYVLVQRLDRLTPQRDYALLVAFAADLGARLVQMQV